MAYEFGNRVVSVIAGSDTQFKVLVRHPDEEAFDLTDVSEITFSFPGKSGKVTATKTEGAVEVLGHGARGSIRISLNSSKTSNLRVGDKGNFEIEVIKNSRKYVLMFRDALRVESRL